MDKRQLLRMKLNEMEDTEKYKELANKIIDGLDALRSKGDSAKVRWIWELIQNAKDASVGQGFVQIQIKTMNNQVQFQHTGNPFTIQNLRSLIKQTSSKDRTDISSMPNDVNNPETTGHFGTGFMTTHLLSSIIYLESFYLDELEMNGQQIYRKFNIILDRSATDVKQFIPKYHQLFKIFDDLYDDQKCPIMNYKLGGMNTTFTYPIAPDKEEVMKQGVTDFKNTAAFVIIFNPKIQKITLDDLVFQQKENKIITENIHQITVTDGSKKQEKVLIVLKSDIVSLAIEVVIRNSIYYIQPRDPLFPTIFADFPLIGSHDFIFPCVVNSHSFWSNEERSSIVLEGTARCPTNKNILQVAIQLLIKFLQFTQIDGHWEGFQHICRIRVPRNSNLQWYQQEIINPFINILSKCKLFELADGTKYQLNQITFPSIQNMPESQAKDLYDIFKPIYKDSMIKFDYKEIHQWFDIFQLNQFWVTQLGSRIWKISFNDFKTQVIMCQSLDRLAAQYFNNQIQLAQKYLFTVYTYMATYLQYSDYQNTNCFANQQGHFKCYSHLQQDIDLVHQEYKVILTINQINIKDRLFCQNTDLVPFIQKGIRTLEWSFEQCINTLMGLLKAEDQQVDREITFKIAYKILQLTHKGIDVDQVNFSKLIQQFYQYSTQLVDVGLQWNLELFTQASKYVTQQICIEITNKIPNLNELMKKDLKIKWLDQLYQSIKILFKDNSWQSFKIFPDQYGNFNLYQNLSQDIDRIDNAYKDALQNNYDIRKLLYHLEVDLSMFENTKQYVFEDCITSMNSCLAQQEFAQAIVVLYERSKKQARFQFVDWISQFYQLNKRIPVKNYNQKFMKKIDQVIVESIMKSINARFDNLREIQEYLKQQSEQDTHQATKQWLTKLYSFSSKNWDQYKIFLDQNQKFQYFKDLSIDTDQIDDIYKDILKQANIDIREKLFDNSIGLQPVKNNLINQIKFKENVVPQLRTLIQTKECAESVALQLLTLIPEEIVIEQKNAMNLYTWIRQCINLNQRINVTNYSTEIFEQSKRLIIEYIVKLMRDHSHLQEFNQFEEPNLWVSELYRYIWIVNRIYQNNDISLNGLLINQNDYFIKDSNTARIDLIIENDDIQNIEVGQTIKKLALKVLQQSVHLELTLIQTQYNQVLLETGYKLQITRLKDVSLMLDDHIAQHADDIKFIDQNKVIFFELQAIYNQGFKQPQKFNEYFPQFNARRERYMTSVYTCDPVFQKGLCQILSQPSGEQLFEKIGNMNDQSLNDFNEFINSPESDILILMSSEQRQNMIALSNDEELMQQLKKIKNSDHEQQIRQDLSKLVQLSDKRYRKFQQLLNQQDFSDFESQSQQGSREPCLQQDVKVQQPDFLSQNYSSNQWQNMLSLHPQNYQNIKLANEEASYQLEPHRFFAEHLIQDDGSFQRVLQNSEYSENFVIFMRKQSVKAYEYVQMIIARAVQEVRSKLEFSDDYDIINWQIDPNAFNKNIVKGVRKQQQEIIIVIRPTDGGWIQFYKNYETQSLMNPNSELWGNNETGITQLLTLGKMINWNQISQFLVVNSE